MLCNIRKLFVCFVSLTFLQIPQAQTAENSSTTMKPAPNTLLEDEYLGSPHDCNAIQEAAWTNLQLHLQGTIEKVFDEFKLKAKQAITVEHLKKIHSNYRERHLEDLVHDLRIDLSNTMNKLEGNLLQHPSCAQVLRSGETDRVAHLVSPLSKTPFKAFCMNDPLRNGTPWMVVQRRMDGSINFTRSWTEYKSGFGDVNSEYWLGLELIHELTTNPFQELWIEMGDMAGARQSVKYKTFVVSSEDGGYRLLVKDFSGDVGDSLLYHDGYKFSTYDNSSTDNAAKAVEISKGGWWYRAPLWTARETIRQAVGAALMGCDVLNVLVPWDVCFKQPVRNISVHSTKLSMAADCSFKALLISSQATLNLSLVSAGMDFARPMKQARPVEFEKPEDGKNRPV